MFDDMIAEPMAMKATWLGDEKEPQILSRKRIKLS